VADACTNAIPIAAPADVRGYTQDTFDTDGPSHDCGTLPADQIATDVWYVYSATASGDLTVSTCSNGTCFDTVVAVYDGTCGALNLLACNDDDDTCTDGVGTLASTVTVAVTSGTDYYIRVAGAQFGDTGCFNLITSFSAGEVPWLTVDSWMNHSGPDCPITLADSTVPFECGIDPRDNAIQELQVTVSGTAPATCTATLNCVNGGLMTANSCTGAGSVITAIWNPETADPDCCELAITGVTGTAWVCSLEGDANQNGAVDPLDFAYVSLRLGQSACGGAGLGIAQADVNVNGAVDPLDFAFVSLRLGRSAPTCPPP
jgi:hypothetical protein